MGGEIDEDDKDTIKCLRFYVAFTFAVKAIQEQSETVQQQQKQIDEENRIYK